MPKGKTNKNNKYDNKKITEYFGSDSIDRGSINIEPALNRNRESEFYTSRVKYQSDRAKCDSQKCTQEKQKLRQHLTIAVEKLKQIKEAIATCKQILQTKDREIDSLKQKIAGCVKQQNETGGLFSSYEMEFTSAGLSELRSIDGKNDSNFVLTGIRFLYRGQLHRLGSVSVTGASRNKGKANPKSNEKMSPEKLNAMKKVFTERLNALKSEEKTHKQRAGRMNYHINSAIQNLNPKKNSKQKLDDLNEQLNSTENC